MEMLEVFALAMTGHGTQVSSDIQLRIVHSVFANLVVIIMMNYL